MKHLFIGHFYFGNSPQSINNVLYVIFISKNVYLLYCLIFPQKNKTIVTNRFINLTFAFVDKKCTPFVKLWYWLPLTLGSFTFTPLNETNIALFKSILLLSVQISRFLTFALYSWYGSSIWLSGYFRTYVRSYGLCGKLV